MLREEYFYNNKIIQSIGNHIILVKKPDMHNTSDFWSFCKNLLEKIEREILLVLVGIIVEKIRDRNDEFNFRSKVRKLIFHKYLVFSTFTKILYFIITQIFVISMPYNSKSSQSCRCHEKFYFDYEEQRSAEQQKKIGECLGNDTGKAYTPT